MSKTEGAMSSTISGTHNVRIFPVIRGTKKRVLLITLLFVDRFSKFQREVIPCDKESALTQKMRHFASKGINLLQKTSKFANFGPIFQIPMCGDSL